MSSNLETIHSQSPTFFVDDGEETDGGMMTVEAKRRLGSTVQIPHASQLIATNITASFVEHSLHPDMNTLIPSLLLNSRTAVISLYDCQQDILMISDTLALCHEDESASFSF